MLVWCDILPRLFWHNNKTEDTKSLNLKSKRIYRAAHQYMNNFGLGQVLTQHILWYMTELSDNDSLHLSDFGKLTYIQTFRNLIHKIVEESENMENPSGYYEISLKYGKKYLIFSWRNSK